MARGVDEFMINLSCEELYALLSTKFETAETDWTGHTSVPKPPYVLYLERKPSKVKADNKRYYTENRYKLELYRVKTDYDSEPMLEKLLDDKDIFWDKERIWNRELNLYQVNYEI